MFKKIIKVLLFTVFILLAISIVTAYYFIKKPVPSYSGKKQIEGLTNEVDVHFDDMGIPHIFAKSETDAYFALGYLIASERLFQLTLIKRLASGRLAEILGESLLESDIFFRTIGLNQYAEWSAETFEKEAESGLKASVTAYINGVNSFINTGPKPLEFNILGIPDEAFSLKDVYLVVGYMALGFAEGMKTDPLTEMMRIKTDSAKMADLYINWMPLDTLINKQKAISSLRLINQQIAGVFNTYPVSPWIGSNSWVISGKKTKSGSVLFCNDTHMGYGLPAVWYEAHLTYPGVNIYGNYVAGLPFALVGHSEFCATGLTMLENDDMDFYYEKIENDKVFYKGEWVKLKIHDEIIKIKGGGEKEIKIKTTPRGPLMNSANKDFEKWQQAVSMHWTLLEFPARSLQATYMLNHAKSMDEARKGAAYIHAPGLNVMYGDINGNIAWWASALLLKRPEHINSKYFLNGFSGDDEPLGYYEFAENPSQENPENGFVYSANNQPSLKNGYYYPGYYVPGNRAERIQDLLSKSSDLQTEGMKAMLMDDYSQENYTNLQRMLSCVGQKELKENQEIFDLLKNWDGSHSKEATAPVFYHHWIWHIFHKTMADELGDTLFNQYMNTHFMKISTRDFLQNEHSTWWDNTTTPEKENQNDIISASFQHAIADILSKYGNKKQNWQWGAIHRLALKHPLGQVKPLNLLFNAERKNIAGSNEVLNNQGFHLNNEIDYNVLFGPAMRRIIDFADLNHSESVLPGGQSGHVGSKFYANQINKFVNGEFRMQWFDEAEIKKQFKKKLLLQPQKN